MHVVKVVGVTGCIYARARRDFSCVQNVERKARERELAKFDESRRAYKAEKRENAEPYVR